MIHERHIKRGTPAELDLEIARFAYKQGRLAEAAEQLRELKSTFPDDEDVVGTLGYVELEMGHFDIALTLLRRAVELHPLWERWSLGVVRCLWELEKFDEALEEVERFLKIHPTAPNTRRWLNDRHQELREKGWIPEK